MRWKGWCFNAVQNNTSLKRIMPCCTAFISFNAVQNNTSLKHLHIDFVPIGGFNAVQNNTSLKLCIHKKQ